MWKTDLSVWLRTGTNPPDNRFLSIAGNTLLLFSCLNWFSFVCKQKVSKLSLIWTRNILQAHTNQLNLFITREGLFIKRTFCLAVSLKVHSRAQKFSPSPYFIIYVFFILCFTLGLGKVRLYLVEGSPLGLGHRL